MKLKKGTVYSRALAIFLLASLLLLGAVAALTQLIILREFGQTESRELKATMQRVALLLEREESALEAAMRNWSQLAFYRSLARGSNLGDAEEDEVVRSLGNLRADFLAVVGADGRVKQMYFRNDTSRNTLVKGLAAVLSGVAKDGKRERSSGFITVENSLCSVNCLKIENSPGILMVGRIFDREAWMFLEQMFSAEVTFRSFAEPTMGVISPENIVDLFNDKDVVISVENNARITGIRLVRGIDGTPIGYFKVSQGRPLRQEGLHASSVFLTGISLAGGALVFLVWLLLDRTILARISDLTNKLEKEKQSGRLPVRLDFKGDDELGTLARSIEDLASRLEHSQDQYRAIVEDQTELICRFDQDFVLTFVNEVFGRYLGGDRKSDLVERLLFEVLPEDAGQELKRVFLSLTKDKPIAIQTTELNFKDGRNPVWLRSTLRRGFDEHGRALGGQWVASDVTTQVLAQKQSLETERRFRRLFETSSDGILLIDVASMLITDINTSLCRMLFLAGSDVLGKRLQEMPVFGPCLELTGEAVRLPSKDVYTGNKRECRLERVDGTSLHAEIRCSRYLVGDRNYIQLNFRNISERVEGEHQMRLLSAKLLRLQDEERRRIARELHDSTAQNLSALEMNISLLEPIIQPASGRVSRIIKETREIVQECSRELRNISYLLHPPLIDEVGLAFAVKWFVDGFAKRTGMAVHLEVGPQFPRLAAEIEMPLFRVVQEAMTNVYRHSRAEDVWITLRHTENEVSLEIRDNGRGFPDPGMLEADGTGGGVGLAGMRERLSNLGGTLDVASSSFGVVVTATLGLDSNHVRPAAD